MRNLLLILCILPIVFGHGLILYDVDLYFDPALYKGIMDVSTLHLGQPAVAFDFEYELITAKVNSSFERSATFSPLDFSLYGERDDAQTLSPTPEIYDANQRRKIAQDAFDVHALKDGLMYGQERKLYNGIYESTWYRFIDGILILNEHFKVEINAHTGRIVAWRQTLLADTPLINPAFSPQVATWIALFSRRALSVEKIQLVVWQKRPLWLLYAHTQLYPTKIGIDALTGEVVFVGPLPSDMPDIYLTPTFIVEPTASIKEMMS